VLGHVCQPVVFSGASCFGHFLCLVLFVGRNMLHRLIASNAVSMSLQPYICGHIPGLIATPVQDKGTTFSRLLDVDRHFDRNGANGFHIFIADSVTCSLRFTVVRRNPDIKKEILGGPFRKHSSRTLHWHVDYLASYPASRNVVIGQ
jgi:hypothetical protein